MDVFADKGLRSKGSHPATCKLGGGWQLQPVLPEISPFLRAHGRVVKAGLGSMCPGFGAAQGVGIMLLGRAAGEKS